MSELASQKKRQKINKHSIQYKLNFILVAVVTLLLVGFGSYDIWKNIGYVKVSFIVRIVIIDILLIIIFSVIIRKMIISPLRIVASQLDSFRKGRMDKRVSIKSNDEIGMISEAFNRMAEDLQKTTISREVLENEQKRFQDIIGSSGDWIWEVDAQGRYTYSSAAVKEVLGYKSEEMINKYFYSFFHPDDRDELKKAAFELFAKKAAYRHLINRNIKKDGTEVILETNMLPVIGKNGELLGYRGVDRDITERKKAEDELQKAHNNIKVVLEKAQFGVVVIGKDRKIRWANDNVVKMAGVENADVILGKKCSEYLCPVQQDECPVLDKNQEVENSERILRRIDGKEMPIIKTVKKITFNNEDVLLETFVDITDRKKAEDLLAKALEKAKRSEQVAMSMMDDANNARKKAEALQAELKDVAMRAELLADQANIAVKTKSAFLANMSHEIRTPMNSVLGFSKLLKKTGLNQKQEEYLKFILSGGEALLTVIDDILDISRAEANKIELEVIDFDLSYLLNDVVKMITMKSFDYEKIYTYVDIDSDVPVSLKGDPTRLRQILINLLGNALKFTHQGAVGILVSLVKPIGPVNNSFKLQFCVKDTGIGISKDKVDAIFEPFTQSDTSTTREYGGAGLGLSICNFLVALMGGEIWVESEEGKGSEFIFTVNLEKGEDVSGKEVFPLKEGDLKGLKIIIVDDNEIARKISTQCCESIGMEIVSVDDSAHSVLDRLDKIESEGDMPELVLCGLCMDGYELVEKIRANEKLKGIKMIAVTAYSEIGEADIAEDKGFDGYLPQPLIAEELAKVISTILGDKREEKTIVTRHMAEELSCKGTTVLVVEDIMSNLILIKKYFDDLGCDGDYVNNGQEAIDKLKADRDKYDLVLMDIQMPVMGGLEATQIIRNEISKDIPIIALTAAVLAKDRERYVATGMNGFLAKPVDTEKLRDMIFKYRRT
ncbi:MAG: response regulator [Candidatus Omnitrophica bacterium]|nr:response regulator [Candidatus Omnitrophota bacterium]